MTPALRGRLRQLAGQWKHRKLPPASVDVPGGYARLRWDGEKIDAVSCGTSVAGAMLMTAYLDCFTHIGLLADAVETAAREREAAERADREMCREAALRVHAALDAIGCPKAGEEP